MFGCQLSELRILELLDWLQVVEPGGGEGEHHEEDAGGVLGHPQRAVLRPPAAEQEMPGQEEEREGADGEGGPVQQRVHRAELNGNLRLILANQIEIIHYLHIYNLET